MRTVPDDDSYDGAHAGLASVTGRAGRAGVGPPPSLLRAGRRLIVAFAVALVLTTGCVPQTPDDDTYRDRTRQAITQANSAVETTKLVLNQLRHDKIFGQYAEVAIRDGEQSLASESDSYDALDPPTTMDALHTSTSTLMSDAASAINAPGAPLSSASSFLRATPARCWGTTATAPTVRG